MGSMGIDVSTSEASTPTEQHPPTPAFSQKRSAGDAGLKSNGLRPNKSVKRRASKACQCCRARKVRCNVVEHGAPCTNCRLDEVECIVSESKRKKYVLLQFVLLLKSLTKLEAQEMGRADSRSSTQGLAPQGGTIFAAVGSSAI